MDGLHSYQRPANNGWLKLLFLSTGFIIAAMCLWAFVEKRMGQPAASGQPVASSQPTDQTMPVHTADIQRVPVKQEPHSQMNASQARQAAEAKFAEYTSDDNERPRQATFETESPYPMVAGPADAPQPEQPASQPVAVPYPFSDPPTPQTAAYRRTAAAEQPLPEPSPPPQPEAATSNPPPRPDYATTLAGDSFWRIAERVYGDPRYYRALFEHNRNWIAYPDQIEQGFRVMTPSEEELRRRFPKLCPE